MVASAAAGLMRAAPLAVPREQTMPAERVPMRDAREIIRLKFSAGFATREIARRLGVAPSTVRETLRRLSMSGLSWPVAEGLSEAELEGALYGGRGSKRQSRVREDAVADDAADACGGGATVRRLRGRRRAGRHRSAHRRSPDGADLRGRPRRVELHVCACELDADVAGLDRRPRQIG